jgi:hypothetical protein
VRVSSRPVLRIAALAACAAGIARAAPGDPRAPEAEERTVIGEYIRAHLEPIQDCYNQRLGVRRDLRGKLVVRLDIERDGKVAQASADGIADPPLVKCVVTEVLTWKFDKPAWHETLRVAYPIRFEPG